MPLEDVEPSTEPLEDKSDLILTRIGTLDQPADVNLSLLARLLSTWQVATKVAAYVVADKDNPSADEQALLDILRNQFHIDLVDDDDVADAKMDFTAYSAIVVGRSCDVAKLAALTDLAVPIVFTKGEHAATIGKMATVGAGNYGTSVGTEWDETNNSHPTVITHAIGVHTLYTESGDLNWLLSTALAAGVGQFANVKDEATHISLAILPLDGINSDGLISPEIRYFFGLPEVTKYTEHTWEHTRWIADWLVHQIALVTVVQSLTKSKIIEEMIGKGKFKKITDLYDYVVTGTTNAPPFQPITEYESRSILERLEWIKNALRRGTGTILPINKSLYDVIALDRLDHGTYGLSALKTLIDAIEGKLDVPANFMADVSALALEATLSTHDTDIKALVPAEVTQRAKSLFVVREKFFSDSVRITVTSTAGSKTIKSNFAISLIPSGVTLDYVHVYVFSQVTENIHATTENKVNIAQYIQIQKVGGTWTSCVAILDDALRVPAETRDMGRLLGQPIDCKAEVDGNGNYNLHWASARVDVDSMNFDDVFFIVEVGYH